MGIVMVGTRRTCQLLPKRFESAGSISLHLTIALLTAQQACAQADGRV